MLRAEIARAPACLNPLGLAEVYRGVVGGARPVPRAQRPEPALRRERLQTRAADSTRCGRRPPARRPAWIRWVWLKCIPGCRRRAPGPPGAAAWAGVAAWKAPDAPPIQHAAGGDRPRAGL